MAMQPSLNTETSKVSDATITEAVSQFKDAASQIYNAVTMIGNASSASAKAHLQDGKLKAMELEERAEEMLRSRPLVAVGVAFAAGWLISRMLQRPN